MTKTPEDRVSDTLDALRTRGGRATVPRRAILVTLLAATHLSAAEASAHLAADGLRVELSTVRRILAALVDAGVVHTVQVSGTTTYGMADHAHHHTVCNRCGDIRQLPHDLVAPLVEAVNAAGVMSVDEDGRGGGVVVDGRCAADCRAAA